RLPRLVALRAAGPAGTGGEGRALLAPGTGRDGARGRRVDDQAAGGVPRRSVVAADAVEGAGHVHPAGPQNLGFLAPPRGTPASMGVAVGLILIAFGAILTWAVNAHVSGVNVTAVGVILLVRGSVGFFPDIPSLRCG